MRNHNYGKSFESQVFEIIISTPYNVGSVPWRLFSTSGDNISTVRDSFSTVEVAQYSGDSFSTVGG